MFLHCWQPVFCPRVTEVFLREYDRKRKVRTRMYRTNFFQSKTDETFRLNPCLISREKQLAFSTTILHTISYSDCPLMDKHSIFTYITRLRSLLLFSQLAHVSTLVCFLLMSTYDSPETYGRVLNKLHSKCSRTARTVEF